MFVSLAVVTVFMSALLLVSAGAKSLRTRHITEQMSTLGVPQGMMAFLIGAQIAGAAGVIAGLWWGPVGIAAAIGLALYFAGAVAFHLRVSGGGPHHGLRRPDRIACCHPLTADSRSGARLDRAG
ncbi:DoxX family protein [Streptomyces sp. NBC_00111]|uniref:DoxX family protein n=1 Tax=Streptomyces sp. NBC_00111 TaxID=2975655 RepID=UPI0032465F86